MSLSMGEVEATARKAARGAGYPWGFADEAGRAARWLSVRGVDGCAALAGLLDAVDGADLAERSPDVTAGVWTAPHAACPLATGLALSDRAEEAIRGVRVEEILAPLLLMPFAALLAETARQTVTLSWDGGTAVTDGTGLCLDGKVLARAPWVDLSPGGKMDAPAEACHRAQPDPRAWGRLNAFAQRTYAPATEASRRKGAGADATDND
jgi:hypothetical protein